MTKKTTKKRKKRAARKSPMMTPPLRGWRQLYAYEYGNFVAEVVYYKREPARVRSLLVSAPGRTRIARVPLPELVLLARFHKTLLPRPRDGVPRTRPPHSFTRRDFVMMGVAGVCSEWRGGRTVVRALRLPNVLHDGVNMCVGNGAHDIRIGKLTPEEAAWMTCFNNAAAGDNANLLKLASRFAEDRDEARAREELLVKRPRKPRKPRARTRATERWAASRRRCLREEDMSLADAARLLCGL